MLWIPSLILLGVHQDHLRLRVLVDTLCKRWIKQVFLPLNHQWILRSGGWCWRVWLAWQRYFCVPWRSGQSLFSVLIYLSTLFHIEPCLKFGQWILKYKLGHQCLNKLGCLLRWLWSVFQKPSFWIGFEILCRTWRRHHPVQLQVDTRAILRL